jgi:amino acid transporter
VALSVGVQGPTAGAIVGPAVLAGLVAGSGALAYLLGLVAMAFVAYAFVTFSRSFNSAGSVYAFGGAALGPSYGLVTAWVLLLVYVSFAGAVYASTADLAQTFFHTYGIGGSWVIYAVVGAAMTMVFAYLSIGLSSTVIFACEGVAIILLLVVVVVTAFAGGSTTVAHHVATHHAALSGYPFLPHGLAIGVLGLGVVNAFGAFSGFEAATTLGEESRRSTRTIPLAVAGSLVGAAAVYIVATWVTDNAYSSVTALANDPAPLVTLARMHIGSPMADLVNAAGVISAFGAQLACINAANRLLFALARDLGTGTRTGAWLTRTDRRHSPVGALSVTGTVSIAALLAFSFEPTAVRALTLIVEYGAYLIILAYLLTVIAALAWVLRSDRRPVPVIVLAVGVVVLGYVAYDTFNPVPTSPFGTIVAVAGASALAGVVVSVLPGVRRRLAGSPLLIASRLPPRRP